MRCRKNFTDLIPVERQRLADALNDAFARGVIGSLAAEHDQHFNHGIHWGPAFLPWHRHFLLRLEWELRQFDDRVAIPYWDWTRADSRDLDAEPWKSFFGGRSNSDGRFDHWNYTRRSHADGNVLPSLGTVLSDLGAATFTGFRAVECGIHVPGHTWTGGTMGGGRSPDDPLFYLHHGNIDRLWAIWQLNHPGAVQYSLDDSPACDRDEHASVELNSPMHGGATPASMLNHVALGYVYPVDEPLLAAARAQGQSAFIAGDPLRVTLETPQVEFNDVPEGDTTHRPARFGITGCGSLLFEAAITAGPFTLPNASPYAYPAGEFPTGDFRIWVQYTGRAPNTSDAGTMRIVARNLFGEEVWRDDAVQIAANSVQRPRIAVTLVLDESGSMLYPAGNNRPRLEVLKLAATTFVDQLYDDNGIAMVAFSDAAETLRDLDVAGPPGSGVRTGALDEIRDHGPPDVYPHTSIGAGIQQAANLIAGSPSAADFAVRATVVFTDGFEDRAPLISEVQHLITDRFYAVGVGDAAHVRNDILRTLANASGGFMLVAGALAQDDEFLMEKFFIQVLAGVLNRDIVRDPEGSLGLGEIARVPFWITRSDIAFDAVALSRAPHVIALALEAPDGTIITVADLAPDSYRPGATSRSLRVTLPVVHSGVEHWEGEWHLLLAVQGREMGRALTHAAKSPFAANSGRIPYHAIVHARSNLHLRAAVSQSGTAPGSTLFLRALLTEYGQPLLSGAQVRATVTWPDSSTSMLPFQRTGPGVYEASLLAAQAGVYRFHLVAEGLAARGQRFTREHLLSAVTGVSPEPGGRGDGGSSGSEDVRDILCCLLGEKVLTGRFAETARRLGIDVEQLRRCLKHLCPPHGKGRPPPDIR